MMTRPLEVSFSEDEIVIRIGMEQLATAAKYNPRLEAYDTISAEFFQPEVTDQAVFAREIVNRLESEEEDGTTLVHLMLDKAVEQAIEYGAEGIETAEERRDKARAFRDFPPETPLEDPTP